MTTIAVCDAMMAADSKTVIGSRVTWGRKIYKYGRGILYGGSGEAALIERVGEWIAGGMKNKARPELKDDAEVDGLLWVRGKLYFLDSGLYPVEIQRPFAIGSGSEYAIALMSTGMNAEEAVQHIVDKGLDPNTGGEVDAVILPRHRKVRSNT